MFFRFAAALMMIVLISMASIWLEKQTLDLRRAVSVQHYQCDALMDMLVQLRLETQELSAPHDREFTAAEMNSGAVARVPFANMGSGSQPNARSPATRRSDRVSSSPDEPQNHRSRRTLLELPPVFDPEGID